MRSPIFPKGSLIAAISTTSSSFFLQELFLFPRSCCFLHTCISPFAFLNLTFSYLSPFPMPMSLPQYLIRLLPFLTSTLFVLELLVFSPCPQLPSCQLHVGPFLQNLHLSCCLFKLSLHLCFPFQHPCFPFPFISPQTYPFLCHQLSDVEPS